MLYKGSKKHVLDLIDSSDFIDTLNTILLPYGAKIIDTKSLQPKGLIDVSELGLQSFINKNKIINLFPLLKDFDFNKWWKPCGGKAPTWDMISLCKHEGKDAILLVEAKAHKKEFNKSQKQPLKENAPDKAKQNHVNIEDRIKEACNNLNNNNSGFKISVDKHYQLSNRVAFALRLKQLNVPVILLYLGFTKDTYFKMDFFKDDVHWNEEFNKYIEGVVPLNFINSKKSDFLFISKSLESKQ